MKLRIEPAAARERLKAEIEALGGAARAIGQLLELSYTSEDLMERDQEQLELTFFVRAWVSTQPDVIAEVVA
jgi:hypothetical protein